MREPMSPLTWSGYGLSVGGCGSRQSGAVRLASLPAWLADLSEMAVRRGLAGALRKNRFYVLPRRAALVGPQLLRRGWLGFRQVRFRRCHVDRKSSCFPGDGYPPHGPSSHPIHLIFMGEAEFGKEQQRLAIAYVKSHPREFIKNSWSRILDIWSAKDDSLADGWVTTLFIFGTRTSGPVGLFSAFVRGSDSCPSHPWDGIVLPLVLCVFLFPIPYYVTLVEYTLPASHRPAADNLRRLRRVASVAREVSAPCYGILARH